MVTPINLSYSTEVKTAWSWIYAAWLASLLALLGSLFFSEVMRYPACPLCWYQRIAMYPLVVIFTVGILDRDPRVARYAWPLVILGLLLALYHNLVYYHVIPESLTPCTGGVPCSSRQLEAFGFLTIPLLSALGFSGVAVCLLGFRHRSRK